MYISSSFILVLLLLISVLNDDAVSLKSNKATPIHRIDTPVSSSHSSELETPITLSDSSKLRIVEKLFGGGIIPLLFLLASPQDATASPLNPQAVPFKGPFFQGR